jgi:hypothetical protein
VQRVRAVVGVVRLDTAGATLLQTDRSDTGRKAKGPVKVLVQFSRTVRWSSGGPAVGTKQMLGSHWPDLLMWAPCSARRGPSISRSAWDVASASDT